MKKKITKEDILKAESVYLYNEDVIFVELKEGVWGFNKGGLEWYKKRNFYDYFESSLMMSYFSLLAKEVAVDMIEEWIKTAKNMFDIENVEVMDE